jgi:predicted nucleic acid-binding protein
VSHYLDTSAAAKILVAEAESEALVDYLDDLTEDDALVSSALLETELRRVAVRLDLDQAAVTDLLSSVDLVEPPRSLFHEAGVLPGTHLRSLDALHLATCLRVGADTLVAYDVRMLDAARSLGLTALSPGRQARHQGDSQRPGEGPLER